MLSFKQGRMGAMSKSRLREESKKEVPYLIENMVPSGTVGIFVGDWGIGKSPFVLQMQLSAAGNVPFLGKFKPQSDALNVISIDFENSPGQMLMTAENIAKYIGLDDIPDNWAVYNPSYEDRPEEFGSMPEESYIKELLAEKNFNIITVDPLRAFKPDAEEKSRLTVKMIQDFRKMVKGTNCSIMFVHHPRKVSQEALLHPEMKVTLMNQPDLWMASAAGTAALVQNTDFRIGMEKDEDDNLYVRNFVRGKGWFPTIHVARIFNEQDEPVCYYMETGWEKLTADEKRKYGELPEKFTTANVKGLLGKGNAAADRFIKRMISLVLVERIEHGAYKKLV